MTRGSADKITTAVWGSVLGAQGVFLKGWVCVMFVFKNYSEVDCALVIYECPQQVKIFSVNHLRWVPTILQIIYSSHHILYIRQQQLI